MYKAALVGDRIAVSVSSVQCLSIGGSYSRDSRDGSFPGGNDRFAIGIQGRENVVGGQHVYEDGPGSVHGEVASRTYSSSRTESVQMRVLLRVGSQESLRVEFFRVGVSYRISHDFSEDDDISSSVYQCMVLVITYKVFATRVDPAGM